MKAYWCEYSTKDFIFFVCDERLSAKSEVLIQPPEGTHMALGK